MLTSLLSETTQAGSRHVSEKIRELNDQHTLQEVDMKQTVTQVQNAQEEYRRILRVHREREANLNKYTERELIL